MVSAMNLQTLRIPGVVVFERGSIVKEQEYCFANGSCADLWKANYNGQKVAVKVWRGVPYTEHLRRSFHRHLSTELGVWAKLKHDNIVSFLGLVQEYGHLPGLVLPFYKNGSLLEYIIKWPETIILPLVKDIASALSYIHTLNPPATHGELKASNVFIDDGGRARLCDFGLGKIHGEMNFTSANICGPCRWTAPEIMAPPDGQDESSPTSTPESDIYSFAMTTLEMYTRKQPFAHKRNDAAVIFEAIGGGRPRRPSVENAPQLTDNIWQFIERCWAQESDARPTATAVVYWLEVLDQNDDSPPTEMY